MIESKILYRGKIDLSKIRVNRVPSNHNLSPDFKAKIQESWEDFKNEAETKGIKLWDGDLYRINHPEELTKGNFNIDLSTIKFSTTRGLRKLVETEDLKPEEYANHICTAGILQTLNKRYVLGLRGINMHKAKYDFIGGGMQEDELEFHEGIDLYRNLLKEMKEESGLDEDQVESYELVGIVNSAASSIIFIFSVKLKINSEQLLNEFKNRTENEMADLKLVDVNQIPDILDACPYYHRFAWELMNFKFTN